MHRIVLFFIAAFIFHHAISQNGYYLESTDRSKIFVEEKGEGEPVILLSGGPGLNPDYLIPVQDKLSQNYRAIILNQRGTGRSMLKSIDSLSMSIENYKNDIEALRKHLNQDKITLIGHSWGGMLAMEYAASYPDNVKNLILMGTGGPTTKFRQYFYHNIVMRLSEYDLMEAATLDSLGKSTLQALYPGYFYHRKMALLEKFRLNFDSVYGQAGVSKFTLPSYRQIEKKRIQLLKQYKGPATIIQGWQDPVGAATAYEIREFIPQIKLNFINQCGHLPWLETEKQRIEFYNYLNAALAEENFQGAKP